MATGVETAGLALAIFPLVIEGVKCYSNGVKTIKDLWRYQAILKRLVRELEMEQCKFNNTCMQLLDGMVPTSELELFMEEPGGQLWKTGDFEERLRGRLPRDSIGPYIEGVEALRGALNDLSEKLGLDNEFGSLDKKARKRQLKRFRLVISKDEHKALLVDIAKINSDLTTLTGQNERAFSPATTASAKHYNRIRRHAMSLYGVLQDKLQAVPACACDFPHNANLQLQVRSATLKSYHRDTNLRFKVIFSFENDPATKKSLPWNWREIELEPLDGEIDSWESKQAHGGDNSPDLDNKGSGIDTVPVFVETAKTAHSTVSHAGKTTFGRLFSTFRKENVLKNITRYATPAKIVPANPPGEVLPFRRPNPENIPRKTPRTVTFKLPGTDRKCPASIPFDDIASNTTEQIENICLSIQQAKSGHRCLGVLVGRSDGRHRVWQPKDSSMVSKPIATISLDTLLSLPRKLTTEDRLVLGVVLASTVLQLHATGWLSESWGKTDILFLQEATTTQAETCIGDTANNTASIRKPLIRRIFAHYSQSPPQAPQTSGKSLLAWGDGTLFSLGVILVELWHGQRLEDIQTETDTSGAQDTDLLYFIKANELAEKLSKEAGAKYSDAVRRCIRGLDHSDHSLDKEGFKNEVYNKVVSPLEQNLESFCGRTLAEICMV